MPKAKLFRHDKAQIDEQELKQLLADAECQEVERLEDGDVLLIVLEPNLPACTSLEEEVMQAIRAQIRIIAIWPKESELFELPPCLKKYASKVIAWSASGLISACQGDDQSPFEDPKGEPIPEPDFDHNKC